MKRIFAGLGIALLGLLAVLLLRALAMGSQQLPAEEWSPILIDSERAVQRLSLNLGDPRDLAAIGEGLERAAELDASPRHAWAKPDDRGRSQHRVVDRT